MATQLDRILKLGDTTIARKFKKTVKAVVNETFDLSLRFNGQPPSIFDEFKRKLIEQFPEILDDPVCTKLERKKRMDAVYIYARNHFACQRCLMKPFRLDGSMTSGTANEYHQKKRVAIRHLKKKYQKSKSSSSRETPPSSASTTNAVLAAPPTTQAMVNEPSESETMPNNSPSTESTPYSPSASQNTLIEPSAPSQMGPPPEPLQTRIEEIADFLHACNPDMSYFLPLFIGFGCRSRGFLVALAGYSDEHIDDILRRMVRNAPSEVVVTEMDIWVLKQGLKKLMLATKSGAIKKREP